MKLFLVFIVAFWSVTPLFSQKQNLEAKVSTKLRTSFGGEGKVMSVINSGESVRLLYIVKGGYRVEYKGKQGFVNKMHFFYSDSVEKENCAVDKIDVDLSSFERKKYKGDYSTKNYKGLSEYSYIEKQDGTRVYDGDFYFQGCANGNSLYTTIYNRLTGFLMNKEKDRNDYDKLYDRFKEDSRRMTIIGNFINGLKEGKWIYISERYNKQTNKYMPTDSTCIDYVNGKRNGLCTYVFYNIEGHKRKREEVVFVSNLVESAVVYHFEHDPVKYESFYEVFEELDESFPTGVWKEKRSDGVVYFDFDNKKTYLRNEQTGMVENEQRIGAWGVSGGMINPFKHGFGIGINQFWDNCYWDRIGDFCIGDCSGGIGVINQIDTDDF